MWITGILVYMMHEIGINIIGTLKKNVKGLPKDRMLTKKTKKRGTMVVSRINLAQDCPVYFTSWVDKKPVHLLHTFPTSFDTISRNTKNRSTQLYVPIEITRPTAVGTYNNGMGGTDLHDQLIAYYQIALRTKRWPRKIYAYSLNIVGVNTHRLYVSHTSIYNERTSTLNYFLSNGTNLTISIP